MNQLMRDCLDCGRPLPANVAVAYNWLYGDNKMSALRFANELRKGLGAFEGADDEAVGEAFEYTTGHTSADLIAAVGHRLEETGP